MDTQNCDDSNDLLSERELKESAVAEREEMLRYKWYEGIRLGHNPEDDRPAWEIFAEWADKYAAAFRENWRARRSRN